MKVCQNKSLITAKMIGFDGFSPSPEIGGIIGSYVPSAEMTPVFHVKFSTSFLRSTNCFDEDRWIDWGMYGELKLRPIFNRMFHHISEGMVPFQYDLQDMLYDRPEATRNRFKKLPWHVKVDGNLLNEWYDVIDGDSCAKPNIFAMSRKIGQSREEVLHFPFSNEDWIRECEHMLEDPHVQIRLVKEYFGEPINTWCFEPPCTDEWGYEGSNLNRNLRAYSTYSRRDTELVYRISIPNFTNPIRYPNPFRRHEQKKRRKSRSRKSQRKKTRRSAKRNR